MQLALLADVHGNLEALDAVLADLDRRAPRARLVCAGDVVGYGPDPEACIERLRERGAAFVLGNHEEMVLGRRNFTRCVRAGIIAAVWTRQSLSARARTFLRALPPWLEVTAGVVVCHGDLADADTYVSSGPRALGALEQLGRLRPDARLLVCGHTHRAMFFGERPGLLPAIAGTEIELKGAGRCLVNPGAVGQARHGRPLASYALLDLDRTVVTYLALEYAHRTTVRKLKQTGLVPRVVLTAPRSAVGRHVAHLMTQWTRMWATRRLQAPDRE